MNTINLIVAICSGLIGLALGIFFGAMPMRTFKTTEEQNRWQQWLSIAFIILFFVLIYFKQDVASWTILIAAIVGIAIAKIPPIHAWFLSRFAIFQPKKQENSSSVNSSPHHRTKKKTNGKKHRHVH